MNAQIQVKTRIGGATGPIYAVRMKKTSIPSIVVVFDIILHL
jgi:hypothetical protein